MNNEVFGKAMENVRKQKNIKLVTAETRGIYLLLEPNYNIFFFLQQFFFGKFISHKNEENTDTHE